MINLAKVYWGDIDISDYVMSVGDFEQFFSNYDCTMKDCECDIVLMSRILVSYPDIKLGTSLNIRQDDKILFHCYITEFNDNSKINNVINVVASSILNKLSKVTVQSIMQTVNLLTWGFPYETPVKLDELNNVEVAFEVIEAADVLEYCFNQIIGIPLEQSINSFKISRQMLLNAGSSKVSANNDLRDKANLISVRQLFDFIGMHGYVLWWDYVAYKFVFAPLNKFTDAPAIDEAVVYESNSDNGVIANKNTFFNFSYNENFVAYITYNDVSEASTEITKPFLLNSYVYAGQEFTSPIHLCCVATGSEFTKWTIVTPNTANTPTRICRWYVGMLKNTTLTTSLFNDFLESGSWFRYKILSCKAVNKGNRYFSELEFIEEIT